MPLPKSWTTVTPLSKSIAMILFILLPFIGFSAGMRYQQKVDLPLKYERENKIVRIEDELNSTRKFFWDYFSDHGVELFYPTKYQPAISYKNTIEDSTLISFRASDGLSLGINILTYKYPGNLEQYKTDLLNKFPSDMHDAYKPKNFKFTTFNGYPAMTYQAFVPRNVIVIHNGYIYAMELPPNPNGDETLAISTIRFNKEFSSSTQNNNQGVCTQDIMQCSNGVWVGRTGPNCQFICPQEQN